MVYKLWGATRIISSRRRSKINRICGCIWRSFVVLVCVGRRSCVAVAVGAAADGGEDIGSYVTKEK